MKQAIMIAKVESGQDKALSFATVWSIFASHLPEASCESQICVIIDALDECKDPKVLIDGLRKVSESAQVSVVLTSRKEAALYHILHAIPSMEIAIEDVEADIRFFVEAEVAGTQLSDPTVRETVVNKLCNMHNGTFLWVQLILCELKSCFTVSQVQEELQQLPHGLTFLYQRILKRLQSTLNKGTLQLCCNVMTWVTTAIVSGIKHVS